MVKIQGFLILFLFSFGAADAADITTFPILVYVDLLKATYSIHLPLSGSIKDIVAKCQSLLRRKGGPLANTHEIIKVSLGEKIDPDYQYTQNELEKAGVLYAYASEKKPSILSAGGVSAGDQITSQSDQMSVKIKDPWAKSHTVSIPTNGCLRDVNIALEEAVKKTGRTIPDGYELIFNYSGKVDPNYLYTRSGINGLGEKTAFLVKRQDSNLSVSNVNQPKETVSTSVLPEIKAEPGWKSVPSRSKYFKEKYTGLVAAVSLDGAHDYSFLQVRALKELVSKMGAVKPYVVIHELLQKADEEPSHTIFNKLSEDKTIQAIAALQKKYGKGDPFEYAKVDQAINPVLGTLSGVKIDMTIYRLFYSIIQELDDACKALFIKKDSTLYNFFNALDRMVGN